MDQKKNLIMGLKQKKKVYQDGLKKNGLIKEERLVTNIKMIYIDHQNVLLKKHPLLIVSYLKNN